MGEKGLGNKKYNWEAQNRQGEVKYSIGNGEAKELICMTLRHELRAEENNGGKGSTGQRRIKERKNGTTVIA